MLFMLGGGKVVLEVPLGSESVGGSWCVLDELKVLQEVGEDRTVKARGLVGRKGRTQLAELRRRVMPGSRRLVNGRKVDYFYGDAW